MKKLVAGAAVGTSLVLALSACAGSASDSALPAENVSAVEALDQVVVETEKVETFSADLTVDGAGKARGSGSFQLKPAPAFTVKLDSFEFAGVNVGVSGTRLILLDQTLYVQNQQLAQFLGGGKPWVKITVGEAASAAGFDPNALLNQFQQADPGKLARIVSDSTDVTRVGTEKIDGVDTVHYKGTVDIKDAITKYDPELKQAAEQLSNGSEKLGFDIWTDAANLPRKVVTAVTTTEGQTFNVTVVFRDYDKPVSVTPPPADQVGDLQVP
ncbi:LppX_LprAFG lipoprotein [Actinocorallia sp. API 0066]|uniref:LppX_LprAFG lipoprotein n=1 Tax=Actinocorallia sp. API 0066 TaxID=2896846 RepID=UPI001E44204B|nr:LppX_LprAFG lipoprotein [Actinocorallia sp. API 0066]MCD0450281.1 LppX_LprAFG lipoprotein [Actinocorallia sp. API 0066]